MRQIILDTETTGLRVEDGHRIIEIACVEMVNRKLTGDYFHTYINPERDIDQGAVAVHGLTSSFLADKPLFKFIAQKLLDYLAGSELIIHNAPFDLSFLNFELNQAIAEFKKVTDNCSVLDTLPLARQLHAGQRNSLDALCKRYSIDNSKRELHGALLDANLLAQVYLAMTGGQGSFFDTLHRDAASKTGQNMAKSQLLTMNKPLMVIQADEVELSQHNDYMASLTKLGKCLWNHSDKPVNENG